MGKVAHLLIVIAGEVALVLIFLLFLSRVRLGGVDVRCRSVFLLALALLALLILAALLALFAWLAASELTLLF